jgi:transposase-like protein
MKKPIYSNSFMLGLYEQKLKGVSVVDICKRAGIDRSTFYDWVRKHITDKEREDFGSAITRSGVREYGSLKKENQRLKEELEQLTGNFRLLQEMLSIHDEDDMLANKVVRYLVRKKSMSKMEACKIVGLAPERCVYKLRIEETDDKIIEEELRWLLSTGLCKGIADSYKVLKRLHPDWTYKQIRRVHKQSKVFRDTKKNYVQGKNSEREKYQQQEQDNEEKAFHERLNTSTGQWIVCFNTGIVRSTLRQKVLMFVLAIKDTETGLPIYANVEQGNFSTADLIAFLNYVTPKQLKGQKLASIKFPADAVFKSPDVLRWCKNHKVKVSYMNQQTKEEYDLFLAEINRNILFAGDLFTCEQTFLAAELWAQENIRP